MQRVITVTTSDREISAKTALIQIVRVRFRAFEAKFGRLPEPNEPLFFDESQNHPVKANISETRAQLAEGARNAGVELDPVLSFLGLAPKLPAKVRRPTRGNSARKPGRYHPQSSGRERTKPATGSSWERFLANDRLHRRHRITPGELQALSRVSFLGETRSNADYLLILRMIRDNGRADRAR